MDAERFELAPLPASDSGPPGHTLNNDSLKNNHWHNSFNTTHTHYHCSANGCSHPSHQWARRTVSTLSSTPEEQFSIFTGQFRSLRTRESTQLQAADRSIDQQAEQTTAISNHVSQAGGSTHLASTRAQYGRLKSQSLISRTLARIGRTLSTTGTQTDQRTLSIELATQNVADYLPKEIDEKYKNYICAPHLQNSSAIPIFDPSTARGEGVRKRIRIDVGDVGTFTMRGGFQVAFNILLDRKTNDLCGYDVPENFFPFVPRLNSEQRQKCYDDGDVINLDKCGAIIRERIYSRDARSHGIDQTPLSSSSQDRPCPLFEISPQVTKGNRPGFIYVSDSGATRYGFIGRVHSDMKRYLKQQLPNWVEYLDKLRTELKVLPIIIASVWAARSFACAAYKSNPNTSATLRLNLGFGERLEWSHAPEGCVTMLAPLVNGYDEHDRLISEVPNQTFAIQGYGLSKKELKKWRAE